MFKTSHAIAAATCALLAAGAAGAATIEVGSATISEGTSFVTVPVTISGGDTIDAIEAVLLLNDGGTELGGTYDGAFFSSLDLSGSYLNDVPNGDFDIFNGAGDQAVQVTFSIDGGNKAVANGLIFEATIDTSGLMAGDVVDLIISPDFSDVGLNSVSVNPSFVNGSITVVPVPEPAAAFMGLAVAVPMLMRRTRRTS